MTGVREGTPKYNPWTDPDLILTREDIENGRVVTRKTVSMPYEGELPKQPPRPPGLDAPLREHLDWWYGKASAVHGRAQLNGEASLHVVIAGLLDRVEALEPKRLSTEDRIEQGSGLSAALRRIEALEQYRDAIEAGAEVEPLETELAADAAE